MELDFAKLIEFIVALIAVLGGVEGTKAGVRYIRNKKTNEFDDTENTGVNIQVPMTKNECALRHSNLTSDLSNLDNKLTDIQQDTKDIVKSQVRLEQQFKTQKAELLNEVNSVVESAIDKHVEYFHKKNVA